MEDKQSRLDAIIIALRFTVNTTGKLPSDEVLKDKIKDLYRERMDSLEASIKQHTVPEGSHLVTRSYVLNSIEFEREAVERL
jgi:hypothetical protein